MGPIANSKRGCVQMRLVRPLRMVKAAAMVVSLTLAVLAWNNALQQRYVRTVSHELPPPVPPAVDGVSPTGGAAGVPVSAEIGAKVRLGKLTDVVLSDAAGKRVAGAFREEGD